MVRQTYTENSESCLADTPVFVLPCAVRFLSFARTSETFFNTRKLISCNILYLFGDEFLPMDHRNRTEVCLAKLFGSDHKDHAEPREKKNSCKLSEF